MHVICGCVKRAWHSINNEKTPNCANSMWKESNKSLSSVTKSELCMFSASFFLNNISIQCIQLYDILISICNSSHDQQKSNYRNIKNQNHSIYLFSQYFYLKRSSPHNCGTIENNKKEERENSFEVNRLFINLIVET